MPETRPPEYPDLDRNATNSAALPLAEALNGYADGAALPAAKYNALGGNNASWVRFFDQRALIIPDLAGDEACIPLGDALAYPTGSGSLSTSPTASGIYLWNGVRLYLLAGFADLAALGLDPVLWTANSDNYLFIDDDYTVTLTPVAIAAPAPATPANAFLLGVARTNGVEVTIWTPGPAPLAFLCQRNFRVQARDSDRGKIQIQAAGNGLAPGVAEFLDKDAALRGRLRVVATPTAAALRYWFDVGGGSAAALGFDTARVVTTLNSDTVGDSATVQRRLRGHVEGDLDLDTTANAVHEGTATDTLEVGSPAQLRVSPLLGVANGYTLAGKVQVHLADRTTGREAHLFNLLLRVDYDPGIGGTVKISDQIDSPGALYSGTTFALVFVGSNVELQVTLPGLAPDARVLIDWRLSHMKAV